MSAHSKPLVGKVALVTGGSRSLGAITAKHLAGDGAAVPLTDSASPERASEAVRAIEAAGGKPVAIEADAASTDATRASVAKTVEAFGGIDILVNNAGIHEFSPLEKVTEEHFHKHFNLNALGPHCAPGSIRYQLRIASKGSQPRH